MADLILPPSLTGKKELIKVQRELESLSEKMVQAHVVSEQLGKETPLPALTDTTSELASLNHLTLDKKTISLLIKVLQQLRESAPTLRISFAVEPDRQSIAKIVSWFRKEVGSEVLLQVGIQPSIAGGCIVQTPGNRYDFSLRKHILGGTDKFKAVLAKEVFQHEQNAGPQVQAQPQTEPQPQGESA